MACRKGNDSYVPAAALGVLRDQPRFSLRGGRSPLR
jgi:hypothetical protein